MTPSTAARRPRRAGVRSKREISTRAPSKVYAGRLARLRSAVADKSVDAALITNPRDVAYLTGFLGGDSYLLVHASSRKKPVIISDFRYEEELEPIRPLADVVIRSKGMQDAVTLVISSSSLRRVGVQAEHMTVAERDAVDRTLGGGRLISAANLVGPLRRKKDDHEVELISRAIAIQEQALVAALPHIDDGMSELDVASILEAEMKRRGSSAPSFETIIAAGANGSLPHYRPGPALIKRNACILIDWGATYGGYHGDMTRTFALGRWPAIIREIYAIVLEAHESAVAALKAGVHGADVDAAARRVITKAGFGDRFGHGLGHGLGLDVHESPRLTHMGTTVELAEGDVVTIEPGIYLPGAGGVRIEDDYLVTRRGCRNLSSLPKSIEWASLG